MKWKEFEIECIEYLKKNYGNFFTLEGGANSTESDIIFSNGKIKFYIEAKMPIAQCGQFVLFPDFNNNEFIYSSKNKTLKNSYTELIINFMNKNFESFSNSGTKGVTIELSKTLLYNWVITYYKEKNVKFFITKDLNEDFIIFPVDKLSEYFKISAKYREKKSGSSALNNANKEDFIEAFKQLNIEYKLNNLNIISNINLDKIKIKGNKYDYLLKKENNKNNEYKVRKLSNTRNSNVIFSIELKKNKGDSPLK